jgi:hypothetical protein
VPSIGYTTHVIARCDLPDETVTGILSQIVDHQQDLASGQSPQRSRPNTGTASAQNRVLSRDSPRAEPRPRPGFSRWGRFHNAPSADCCRLCQALAYGSPFGHSHHLIASRHAAANGRSSQPVDHGRTRLLWAASRLVQAAGGLLYPANRRMMSFRRSTN